MAQDIGIAVVGVHLEPALTGRGSAVQDRPDLELALAQVKPARLFLAPVTGVAFDA